MLQGVIVFWGDNRLYFSVSVPFQNDGAGDGLSVSEGKTVVFRKLRIGNARPKENPFGRAYLEKKVLIGIIYL